MLKISEIKFTMATAIAAAFGFIIALIWRDIIIGLMTLVGWWKDSGFADFDGAMKAIAVGIFITIVAVLGILFISKWGGIEKK